MWLVKLDAQDAGGPYTIKATSKVDTKTLEILLEDVLFGDVWICSGQSNMQFTVHQVRYRTIIPRARMGYSLRGHEGERNNCFSKIQLVGQTNIKIGRASCRERV